MMNEASRLPKPGDLWSHRMDFQEPPTVYLITHVSPGYVSCIKSGWLTPSSTMIENFKKDFEFVCAAHSVPDMVRLLDCLTPDDFFYNRAQRILKTADIVNKQGNYND